MQFKYKFDLHLANIISSEQSNLKIFIEAFAQINNKILDNYALVLKSSHFLCDPFPQLASAAINRVDAAVDKAEVESQGSQSNYVALLLQSSETRGGH